jgi:hypothetical protein
MNMSDDVAGATLQMSVKVAEVGGHLANKVIDVIAKLLENWMAVQRAKAGQKPRESDLTGIKPGEVSMKQLVQSAVKTGDQIAVSDHALSAEDRRRIAEKARKSFVPVGFTETKDKQFHVHIRKRDLPVLRQICTEVLQEKIAEHPQELGNFAVQKWEIPFLAHELDECGVTANFGRFRNGEHFCLYDHDAADAVLAARENFRQKCLALEDDVRFEKDADGFHTITSVHTGVALSFDELPTAEHLQMQMQEMFGYDENTAKIASCKFGEEALLDEEKQQYFANAPEQDFEKISPVIRLKDGEDYHTIPYRCWSMTPKLDGIPRIVFADADARFAVLDPTKMTSKQMQTVLQESLQIKDPDTLSALADKAQKISDTRVEQENTELSMEFAKEHFDLRDPETASHMLRSDADGHTYTKTIPVSSVHNKITRTDRDGFTVTSTATMIEHDEEGTEYRNTDTKHLTLSFSDKKRAVSELQSTYRLQGIPGYIADKMARDVFAQAREQSPERAVLLDEVREHDFTVRYDGRRAVIPIADQKQAASKIREAFGVSDTAADQIVDRAVQHQTGGMGAMPQEASEIKLAETTFAQALNRMTDRDLIRKDSMIVCSAANPRNYIRVRGRHNKKRTVHDYEVYRNGVQQSAAELFGTNGVFTDEHSKDANGKPERVVLENGLAASYWSALKQDMLQKSGIDGDHVLVFEKESDHAKYTADHAKLERGIADVRQQIVRPPLPEKLPDLPAPRRVR